MSKWPKSEKYVARFRVPDLLPPAKEFGRLRAVFIGESPHRDEVKPESPLERTPFRGVAGREWWGELAKFVKDPPPMKPVPARPVLEEICSELRIVVMNAVQFPIDPKIAMHQGEASSPCAQLGFEKGTGDLGYKKIAKGSKAGPVQAAVEDLAGRFEKLSRASAQLVCLGNDSRWFTEQALALLPKDSPLLKKEFLTVPHPSSWWRNASYRKRAVDVLQRILS